MTRPTGRHILTTTAAFTISLALAGCAPQSLETATTTTRTPTASPSATPEKEKSSTQEPKAPKEARLGFGPEDVLEDGTEPAWSISISDIEKAGWTMNSDDSDPSAGRWSFAGPNDGIAILQQQRIKDLTRSLRRHRTMLPSPATS